MTRTIFVLLILGIVLSSCGQIQKKKRIPACKSLFEQIKTDWYRDENAGVYRMRPSDYPAINGKIIAGQDCLKGLSSSDFQKLFGIPDTTYGGGLTYYLREPCLEKEGIQSNGCSIMRCALDAEGKVRDVGFSTYTFKH